MLIPTLRSAHSSAPNYTDEDPDEHLTPENHFRPGRVIRDSISNPPFFLGRFRLLFATGTSASTLLPFATFDDASERSLQFTTAKRDVLDAPISNRFCAQQNAPEERF